MTARTDRLRQQAARSRAAAKTRRRQHGQAERVWLELEVLRELARDEPADGPEVAYDR